MNITSLMTCRALHSPDFRYVCDPVLGDNGKLYVPAELVDIYKSSVLPLAYMVTPNAFECEKLTGLPVTTVEEGVKACDALHAIGPRVVVITSMRVAEGEVRLIYERV